MRQSNSNYHKYIIISSFLLSVLLLSYENSITSILISPHKAVPLKNLSEALQIGYKIGYLFGADTSGNLINNVTVAANRLKEDLAVDFKMKNISSWLKNDLFLIPTLKEYESISFSKNYTNLNNLYNYFLQKLIILDVYIYEYLLKMAESVQHPAKKCAQIDSFIETGHYNQGLCEVQIWCRQTEIWRPQKPK